MPFDFTSFKSLVRRTVHKTFGARALYQESSTSVPVEIRARWHNKIEKFGDLDNQLYAELVQGVDRIVFNALEVRAIPIQRGGVVSFPDMAPIEGGTDKPTFVLELREPATGPDEEVWQVTRKELP